MQREIVGTNGEHLSVFGGERRQSSDRVGEAAASNVVAADRPGLPVAARSFWARPARAIAATAGLRDVQRAFGPKRYAPWVIESADDDVPCRGSSGDERKPEAKSERAEQQAERFRQTSSDLLKQRPRNSPRTPIVDQVVGAAAQRYFGVAEGKGMDEVSGPRPQAREPSRDVSLVVAIVGELPRERGSSSASANRWKITHVTPAYRRAPLPRMRA